MRAVDSTSRSRRDANAEAADLNNRTAVDDVALHDEPDLPESAPVDVEREDPPQDNLDQEDLGQDPGQETLEQENLEESVEQENLEQDNVDQDNVDQENNALDRGDQGTAVAATAQRSPQSQEPDSSDSLWSGPEIQVLRDRWREVQLRFVDDPQAAADEAASIVDEARSGLTAAIETRCTELGRWRSTDGKSAGDTEELRMVVQRYRSFLDRVLAV
jgi:hypothetical protein